ncbi:MAG: hypothetical protein ACKKMR_03305 [Candidatus Nealsonbacteria bacterium]
MNIKTPWLVLVSISIILILTGLAFYTYNYSVSELPQDTEPEIQTETPAEADSQYPRNLLEAFIISVEIDSPKGNFKVKVDLNKIFPEEVSHTKEVTVLTDETTKFSVYYLETQEETPATIEDFGEGVGVVIAIKEDNDTILIEDSFTALRMMKMIGPFIDIQ